VVCIRDIQTKARIVDCVLGCHRDPCLPDVAWGNIAVAKAPTSPTIPSCFESLLAKVQ
jgi:hypothetical protein